MVVVAAVAMAGCSTGEGDSSSGTPTHSSPGDPATSGGPATAGGETSAALDGSDVDADAVFPFGNLIRVSGRVMEANEKVISACMSKAGFTYDPNPLGAPSVSRGRATVLDEARQYLGTIDPQFASSFGFHSDPATLPPGHYDDQGRYWADLPKNPSPEYIRALTGSGPVSGSDPIKSGGCGQQAVDALWQGSVADPDSLVNTLQEEAQAAVSASADYQDALAAWRECVSDRGFPADIPLDMPNRYRSSTGEPSPNELAAAVADVECKQESTLFDTWVDVTAAAQRRLADDHALELQELQDRLAEVEQRANKLLAGS